MASGNNGARIALIAVGTVLALTFVLCGVVGAVAMLMPPAPDDDPTTASRADDSGSTVEEEPPAEEPEDEPSEQDTEDDTAEATPEPDPEPSPSAKPKPRIRTFLVAHVVDGDTLNLGSGESVRLVGIDTPEVGECGYEKARDALVRLVEGKQVRLGRSDEDRDQYDRLLRYVDIGGMDAGMRLIKKGLAIARYDSRDGYGRHPREDRYLAADEAAPDVRCEKPRAFAGPPKQQDSSCAPGYSPCVPHHPPDLDCADVGPVTVTGPDPHGLDADGDGVACGGD